ncbi:MAG TPA: DUF423 domain-containing protein [Polyangiaceae bacterium]|nr:DUF423 domain-containing protein [Polyangiaceae bacterium]
MGGWLAVSGVSGFLAVALGAFGAHGLQGRLVDAADGAKRLSWWQTSAQYHLLHAVALGLVALLIAKAPGARFAGIAFVIGTLLFSGSLYAMALGGPRWLGAVTPLGGLGFLAGWAVLGWCGFSLGRG